MSCINVGKKEVFRLEFLKIPKISQVMCRLGAQRWGLHGVGKA